MMDILIDHFFSDIFLFFFVLETIYVNKNFIEPLKQYGVSMHVKLVFIKILFISRNNFTGFLIKFYKKRKV